MKSLRFIACVLCLTNLCLYPTFSISQEVWTKTSLIDKYQVSCLTEINNALYAGLGGGGVYQSEDNGISWTECNNGLGLKFINAIAGRGNRIYASSDGEGVYSSDDKGKTWSKLISNPDKFIYSLAISGPYLIAATWSGIYYTKDDKTWAKAEISGNRKHNIVLSLLDTKKGILGGSGNFIFQSKDNGQNWTTYPTSSSFDIQAFTEINNEILAGTTGEGILLSPDGQTWISKVPNKSESELKSVTVIVNDSSNLIACSQDKGVINAGDKMINGKSDLSIKSFAIHKGNYFAGTYKQGLWTLTAKRKLNELDTRSVFELSSAIFPNPAYSNSTLEYTVNQKANVIIEVVYPDGKLYKRINYGHQTPGTYQIKLQDFNLSSGIYYLRLKANDQSQVKKLVIIS